MKRVLVAAFAACLSIAFLAGPSGASSPRRGCPPPFDGPLTIDEVLEKYPPPQGVEDPYGAIQGYDRNGDLKVCVLPLPPGSINVVDNAAAT